MVLGHEMTGADQRPERGIEVGGQPFPVVELLELVGRTPDDPGGEPQSRKRRGDGESVSRIEGPNLPDECLRPVLAVGAPVELGRLCPSGGVIVPRRMKV